jgi:hypothetical protein
VVFLGITLVLGILEYRPGLGGLVHIALAQHKIFREIQYQNKHYPHNLILISSIYLSYQGGGDYRGIYDTGFKRGFYGVYRPFIECPLQER